MMLSALSCLSWFSLCNLIILVAFLGLVTYCKVTLGVCTSKNRLDGKTVIITGANTGIGKETALDLAHRGARVILACRDLKKATTARDDIVNQTGNSNVVVQHLDTSSLQSVREFAKELIKREKRLDILINNAGCAGIGEKKLTEDGLEYQMATNYFGHFLLTNLLLGLLKRTCSSRIINVSSLAHTLPKSLNFDNLNSELSYDASMAYHYSKLCQVLSTRYLAAALKDSGVTINSLHPGVVATEIFRTFNSTFNAMLRLLPIFKSSKEGAQTTIHLAVADGVQGVTGQYFSDCKIKATSKLAQDDALAKKLWELSETLVNLQPEERLF